MIGLLSFVLAVLASRFKSTLRLETENAVLRHQLIVLRVGCLRHGHPGQAHRTSFALAEWLCRTADRIDPA
jgi:hypothetical protein